MTNTKVQPNEVIGDDLPILLWQKKRIMQDCAYQVDTKNEYVQWVTGDVNRTSLTSITQAQAIRIMQRQTGTEPKEDSWGLFDKDNRQHLTLLAYMRTAQWTKPNEKHGEVADIERLSDWLKSDKSPINKPLKQMETWEVSKIIEAFKGIVKSKYK
jgi:hypothetical protein